MPLSRRRGASDELNPWPGYVDALSTLLMVIIFVLLVFVLAQAFLSVALTGRDRALDRLNRQVSELTEMLSLERGRAGELQLSGASLNRDLQAASAARDQLTRELAGLRADQANAQAERDALKGDRDRLSARLGDAELQAQSALARNTQLQGRLAETAGRTDAAGQETASVAAQLAEARRQLAQAQAARASVQAELDRTVTADRATIEARMGDIARLTALREQLQHQVDAATTRAATAEQQRQALAAQLAQAQQQVTTTQANVVSAQAELDRTVKADRATIEARISDIAKLGDQVKALIALRDELEKQVAEAAARATTSEQARQEAATRLAESERLGETARAQIALLNQQVTALRTRMEQVAAQLDIAEQAGRDQHVQITNLSTRLNAALASKVEELQQYRSEFFGKLREVLQNRQDIQIVGDRFVFQSEVLFPVGSADLTPSGQEQIKKLAATLKQIAAEIPKDVNWVLRVDGHADKQPRGHGDAGNWELSAQRAINVVKLLVDEGIPADRLAATGFGEYQPLDAADTPAAYAKNRRIELRLTDR